MNHKALFWERIDDDIKCLLCPHYCIIKENKNGRCRKRVNKKGILYAENYGKSISLNLDPLEKKPLYHFYPGENVLSLGSNSCNLTCKFCQNFQSSQFDCNVTYIAPKELLDICLKKSIKHVAFTYTEPFTWYEYVLDCAMLLRENNISVILVTNGYINQQPLENIISYISAMNIDLKSFSERFYNEICGGDLQTVLETIKFSHNKTHLEITLLLIESLNDDIKELNDLFHFIGSLNKNIPFHISRYFPRYQLNLKETSEKTLFNAVNIAKKYLNYVYVGNLKSEFNNTFCQQCKNILIERLGYKTNILGIKNGVCVKCNNPF